MYMENHVLKGASAEETTHITTRITTHITTHVHSHTKYTYIIYNYK